MKEEIQRKGREGEVREESSGEVEVQEHRIEGGVAEGVEVACKGNGAVTITTITISITIRGWVLLYVHHRT
jgi:hypothetical protein